MAGQVEGSGLFGVNCDGCGKRAGAGSSKAVFVYAICKSGWTVERQGKAAYYCRKCSQERKAASGRK